MEKKKATFALIIFLVLVSIALFFLSKVSFFGPLNSVATFLTSPLQHSFYALFYKSTPDTLIILRKENADLRKQLVNQKKMVAQNSALLDQFKTDRSENITLLPAYVIGAPGFFPGVSPPEMLILDKGRKNGVEVGQIVVVNDNLVGKIVRVSYSQSVVSLLLQQNFSFTAKTIDSEAVGIVTGDGNMDLTLKNVMVSQRLKKGDIVVTKGDIDASGKGYLPDLVVGKIVAVDRKPSELFQTAKIKSLVDIGDISEVFIVPFRP